MDLRMSHSSFGGVISQSTKAHRLSIKAYKIGGHPLQEAVLTTIFKASCEQLKDIGDTQVLADVAESTGTMTRHDVSPKMTRKLVVY